VKLIKAQFISYPNDNKYHAHKSKNQSPHIDNADQDIVFDIPGEG